MKTYLLAGAAMLALAACAEKPASLGPNVVVPAQPGLGAAQVQQLVVGNTGSGPMSGSQVRYVMYAAPNGNAELRLPTGIETGKWRILSDGQFCTQFENFRDAEEHCQRVYPEAGQHKFVDRSATMMLTFVPGRAL
ncbi:MAG: hypothetical protein ACK4NA_03690 [Alphaproteobacteria bacterium]